MYYLDRYNVYEIIDVGIDEGVNYVTVTNPKMGTTNLWESHFVKKVNEGKYGLLDTDMNEIHQELHMLDYPLNESDGLDWIRTTEKIEIGGYGDTPKDTVELGDRVKTKDGKIFTIEKISQGEPRWVWGRGAGMVGYEKDWHNPLHLIKVDNVNESFDMDWIEDAPSNERVRPWVNQRNMPEHWRTYIFDDGEQVREVSVGGVSQWGGKETVSIYDAGVTKQDIANMNKYGVDVTGDVFEGKYRREMTRAEWNQFAREGKLLLRPKIVGESFDLSSIEETKPTLGHPFVIMNDLGGDGIEIQKFLFDLGYLWTDGSNSVNYNYEDYNAFGSIWQDGMAGGKLSVPYFGFFEKNTLADIKLIMKNQRGISYDPSELNVYYWSDLRRDDSEWIEPGKSLVLGTGGDKSKSLPKVYARIGDKVYLDGQGS